MKNVAVLTYNQKHRKTYDALCLLKAKGYQDVMVYAQPMTYIKKRFPLVQHRPELNRNIPEPDLLCRNLGYRYIEGKFEQTTFIAEKNTIFLLCGAGLLSDEFVSTHRIVNAHPGLIPYARGLDAYKWSVYYNLPIGVSTHFIGEYVDAGEIIERRTIEIREYDSFHSVAQRIYENEIDMLVGAIEKADETHVYIIPENDLLKRMPAEKEAELFRLFERYRKK